MGNRCCKVSLSSPPNPLPSLLSYKKNDTLPKFYHRLKADKPIEINVNDIILPPIKPIQQTPLNILPPTFENYIVVWLTSNIDEDEDAINQVKRIVISFRLFTDIDEFFAFIIENKEEEEIILILSDILAQKILSFIYQTSQLIEIYILSHNQSTDEQWIKQYKKIQGIFYHIEPVCDQLKQKTYLSENDIISIDILNSSSIIIQYFIKQILLYEINYHEKSKKDFIAFAREQYPNEVDIINEFELNYTPSTAVRWYTRKCFLYSAMNQAFGTENIDLLITMGFFIRDLHQEIDRLDAKIGKKNAMIVYQGQGILENELERIKNNKNGFLSFKNFLWANTDRQLALRFSHLARNNPDFFGVLYRININSLIKLICYLNSKCEILVSIYSLFRIGEIKQIEEKIWQIDLILIDYNDQQLKDYFKPIVTNQGQTAWQQLAFHFIQLNQYDKAEELYKILIESNAIDNSKQLASLYEQLGFIYHKKNDFINSLLYYEKSLKYYLNFLSQNDSTLFPIYLNIALLLRQQNNSTEAVQYLKCALNIAQHSSQIDHLQIATLYHRIAKIYEEEGRFADSIQNYQSALESEFNHFPRHHVTIAKTYHKIGQMFYRTEDYTAAFSSYHKSLQIQKKSLSPNHSLLAITNYHIARALAGLLQYKEAIEYAANALNIARHTFGSNHEDVRLYEDYLKKLRRKTLIGVIPNGAVYE
jgi:tetratricopeptide (TPR) repeat protein